MKIDAVQAEIYLVPLAVGGTRSPTASVRAAPPPLALYALAFSVSLGCATAPGVRVHHLSRVPTEGEVSTVDTNALAVGSMGTVHVRGLTANARSELLTLQGYSVCDSDASACDPGTGVEFIEDTSIPSDGNGLYRAELTYEVPPTAAHPQVVPISFLDKQISTGGSDDVVRPLDYQVPIRNVTQVTNNLSINGTAADQEETDVRFGEITFLPPDFTKAYALIRGGILAVVDTTTDEGQQPAEIDLAVTNNGATTASQRMSILKGLGDLDFQLPRAERPWERAQGNREG